jgi:hypothetical protein
MDPAGTPAAQMSVHGLIHGLAGGIVFLLMPVIIFVFLRRFLSDPEWRALRGWTLVLGIIEAAGVIVFTAVSKMPAGQNPYTGLLGLFQRVALIPFMLWLCGFAIVVLRKLSRRHA